MVKGYYEAEGLGPGDPYGSVPVFIPTGEVSVPPTTVPTGMYKQTDAGLIQLMAATTGPSAAGGVIEETDPGWGVLLAGFGRVALGFLKTLLARYGPTILKGLIGGAAFGTLVSLITGGASDDTMVTINRGKGRGRRYSIGTNPRLNTLLKVAKRVDNIFARYDSRISKFRSRIRGTRRTYRRRAPAPPYAYLSPVEMKQLGGGR